MSAHDDFIDRAAAIEHSDPKTYTVMCRYLDESVSRIDRLDHELHLHQNVQRQIDWSHANIVDRVCDYIDEGNTERALKLLRALQVNLEKSEVEV
jgi:hypothetical protein